MKILKRKLLTLLIISLTIIAGTNFVSAENETQLLATEEEEDKLKIENDRTGELVSASEDGNYNISFDDGYNGYCINYGDHEAKEGHNFTVQDTSYAINHKSKQSVGNELKTFFVDYYDIAMKDTVVTQHVIWHFTNDFNGWRIDPNLIENIKATSSQKIIPDHGAVKKINNTTEAVFNFEVLDAHEEGHQNFFAYNVVLRAINELVENETENSTANETNTTDINQTTNETGTQNNQTANETGTQKNDTSTNMTNINQTMKANKTTITEGNDPKDSDSKSNSIKHSTGYSLILALLAILIAGLLIVKYRRD